MWKLLKNELKYNIVLISLPTLIIVAALLKNYSANWENTQYNLVGMKNVMAVGLIIIVFFWIVKNIKEKRDRLLATLPISRSQHGFHKIIFLITIWSMFLLIYWLSTIKIFSQYSQNILWQTLSQTGFVFSVLALVLTFRDVSFVYSGNFKKIILILSSVILFIVAYLTYYILFASPVPYFQILNKINIFKEKLPTYSSMIIFLIFSLISSILLVQLNIYIFKRRKYFLE
jgi:hypothetical protein